MTDTMPRLSDGLKTLSDGWQMCLTAQGVWQHPSDRNAAVATIPARVPGTVAEALESAGLFDRQNTLHLDDKDAWYFCTMTEAAGAATLQFEGLATIAEIYLNGTRVLSTGSMFQSYSVDVDLTGTDELAICFRALGPVLSAKQPRARWRPQMIVPAAVRMVRTTVLGRMPGWCPETHAVGPYRQIRLLRKQSASWYNLEMVSSLAIDGATGLLAVSLQSAQDLSGHAIACGDIVQTLTETGPGLWEAKLEIANVALWWPRTHGEPVLHDIEMRAPDGQTTQIGKTGFRSITIDRGADGEDFGIKVNGVPVFCRGAVWTNADIVRLPGERSDYQPWLQQAAEAGFNMVRIGGTMTYESQAFFDLCDELGLLVWQDAMLANFDYPAGDAALVDKIQSEIRQLLTRTAASPSFAVLCGGSEMYQQAAMLGLPKSMWAGPLTEEMLPAIVADIRPDLGYVPNSPSGGPMPFTPNAGVTHYYGVGAYCRPLEDARRADVRFSAESLAFAHVPEQETLDQHLPVQPLHDPRWKARVPRDRGASWDFEDIRDHYLGLLYGYEPSRLRREEPALYLTLSRAVTGEVLEATYTEWRRHGSTCHGALVFTMQDLLPGAGWGVIDSTGLPKPVWHAMRRAFRPVQVLLTDEGTNGLDVHLINEKAEALDVTVEIACLRDGQVPVVRGQRSLQLDPRSVQKLAATDLFGAFFDTTYAFRFGPPAHSVTVATLKDADGTVLATAFHFPQGRAPAIGTPHVQVQAGQNEHGHYLDLQTDQVAQSVHISCPGYLPTDNWFHLAPGTENRIFLRPISNDQSADAPQGEVACLGMKTSIRF